MEQRFVSAYNESSKRFLGSSLAVVDSAREPIKVLKILMEGLAPEDEAGLWLINFRGVPIARSHNPFDLAFLDEDDRILQAVEITQTSRFVPFKGSPASALILPPRCLSSSGTFTGDHILFRDVQVAESDRPHTPPQSGTNLFSRIVRATMVKNFNVPDEQAAAAPRSGSLMRSARSLSIKPPQPTADELEHERLAARVAAATADPASGPPPSVQWVSPSAPQKAPAPSPPAPLPAESLAPPAPPPNSTQPTQASPLPSSAAPVPPAIEPEPEVVPQPPSRVEESAASAPAAMPLELEALRADVISQPEPETSAPEFATEKTPAAAQSEAPAFVEPAATPEPFQAAPVEEFEPAISEPAFSEPLPAREEMVAQEETAQPPALLPADQPEAAEPSYSAHQEPDTTFAAPAPFAAEEPQPSFNIEDFQRVAPVPPAPVAPAEPAPPAPPSVAAETKSEIRPEEALTHDHQAAIYTWTERHIASTPVSPPTSSEAAEPAHASQPAQEPEPEEDPVSRDVALLISSNVAAAAGLPLVVLATAQSIVYGTQIETHHEDEPEEETAPEGEPLYLRTIERKPATPPAFETPRRAPEPERKQTPPAPPAQEAVSTPEKKRPWLPDPPLDLPSRPPRTTPPPQRMRPAIDEEAAAPARPAPQPPAPLESASSPVPAQPREREPLPPPPRPAPRRPQPTAIDQGRTSQRPRFEEAVVPPPQSALVPTPEPPRPVQSQRPHPAPVTPESSHVAPQAPARPTPKLPAVATKLSKRWDVKLLYSLFPDLHPDFRPELEQPVVNFNKDAGKSQEEDAQSRRLRVLNWIYPDLHLDTVKKRQREVRRAPRIPVPGLVGYFFTGGKSEPHEILNISVMGFYMKTTQRWMPGTVIRITLQMIDSDGSNPTDSITVLSRVVNWDNDGGGFEFVLPGLID